MDIETVLKMRVSELDLTFNVCREIFFEWFICTHKHLYPNIAAIRAAVKSEQCEEQFKVLTVGDVISGYGNVPRREDRDRFGRYFKIPAWYAFVQFAKKLRKIGLSSTDWPLLAETLPELYQALLLQALGDKEKLREVTLLALGVPATITRILEIQLEKCRRDITIGDLLQIRPSELQRLSGRNKITKTLADARAALISLGFTSNDGDFLFENSFKDVTSKISSDLGIDTKDAGKFLKYFQAYFKVKDPVTEE